MTVRTRFAPSPTGFLHIGGARTALFSWLHAKRHGGTTVLRIEDTDRERSTEASVQAILDGLAWLGLDHDEGPFFQTRRIERYREVVQVLLDAGRAYHCYCTPTELDAMREEARARGEKPRYNGHWRDRDETPPPGITPVVRFRNPLDGEVVFEDAVKGRVAVDNRELDDLVILRSDGMPTYNLSVVVDDLDMGITHVVRGDDHVNNTPRQLNIIRALGAEPPVYAHLPMILGEDGKRLSKRHGAVSVMQYAEDGYLPEALLNYLARLGWSHGDRELFAMDELVSLFALGDVNRAGAVFDTRKLDWVNQQYIQSLPASRLADALQPFLRRAGVEQPDVPPLVEVVDALRERSRSLLEMAAAARCFYVAPERYESKAAKQLKPAARPLLEQARDELLALERWERDAIQASLEHVAEQAGVGFGKVGQPLRVAITGGGASPSMDLTLALVGREPAIERIDRALAFIDTGVDD